MSSLSTHTFMNIYLFIDAVEKRSSTIHRKILTYENFYTVAPGFRFSYRDSYEV